MDPADASLARSSTTADDPAPAPRRRFWRRWGWLSLAWFSLGATLPDAPVPTVVSAGAMLGVLAGVGLLWPAARAAFERRRRARALEAITASLHEGRAPARIEYPGVRDRGTVIEVDVDADGDGVRAVLAAGHAIAALVTLAASHAAATSSALGLALAGVTWMTAWMVAGAPRASVRFDGKRRKIEQCSGGAVDLELPIGALREASVRAGLERSPEGPVPRRWVALHSGSLGSPFRTASVPSEARPVSVRVPNLPEPVQEALSRRLAELFS